MSGSLIDEGVFHAVLDRAEKAEARVRELEAVVDAAAALVRRTDTVKLDWGLFAELRKALVVIGRAMPAQEISVMGSDSVSTVTNHAPPAMSQAIVDAIVYGEGRVEVPRPSDAERATANKAFHARHPRCSFKPLGYQIQKHAPDCEHSNESIDGSAYYPAQRPNEARPIKVDDAAFYQRLLQRLGEYIADVRHEARAEGIELGAATPCGHETRSETAGNWTNAYPVGSRVRVIGDDTPATVVPRPPPRYVFVRFDGEPDRVNHPMTADELAPLTGCTDHG